MNTTALLFKLAAELKSPERRLFLLGAAKKAADIAPQVALGGGGLILNAMGLGIPDPGMTSLTRKANNLANTGVNIAKIRHYRMQRVKGVPAPEALARTHMASQAFKLNKPFSTINRGQTIKKGIDAAETPVSEVFKLEKGKPLTESIKDSSNRAVSSLKRIGAALNSMTKYIK